MGSDFQQKTKKTIVKYLDAKRVDLATVDLLTVLPTDLPRSFLASLEARCDVSGGMKMMAEVQGNTIRLRQGNSYVARLDNPPADLIAWVASAGGTGATIVHVHALSKKLEVSLW
ncbi:hypothetical protein AMC87_PB00292 (plasmid) [Rhizobium phaseoli]|uniref:hypothetical protein n=1 Tax=Rhizobium phaseoli TaxID=396 RepID=UPI0007EB6E55|nr:hypothetical protein [Rhizobium phaseoli]ANL49616.1 hypothetical protein AMC87_PB00292 [Rhizobium phaseoli]